MLVNQSSGPFSIANYNARDTVFKNDFIKVEWSVANTDQSPVNCKTVDIYWSIAVSYTHLDVYKRQTL